MQQVFSSLIVFKFAVYESSKFQCLQAFVGFDLHVRNILRFLSRKPLVLRNFYLIRNFRSDKLYVKSISR